MTPDRPLRIALVSREYPPFFGGGIGSYARHIAPALARSGAHVHVLTQAHDPSHPRVTTAAMGAGSLTVHRVPLPSRTGSWTRSLLRWSAAVASTLDDLRRDGRIDLAEFAECEAAGLTTSLHRAMFPDLDDPMTLRSGPAPRLPTVVHLHTPSEMLLALRSLSITSVTEDFAAYVLAERAAIHAASAVCAPSRFIADWAQRHYELSSSPEVIPYAIAPLPPVQSLGDFPTSPRVLFVGRIEPRKGIEPLLRAWARVRAAVPGAELRIAGSDTSTAPGGSSLRGHLARDLSIDARGSIQFLGPLPPEVLTLEYARASLCVIPSLWENYPNTCLEALAHARPVVVSDAGGMREMFEGTPAGLTFPTGCVESLADAMISILHEPPAQQRARGLAGREHIAALCDPARIASRRIDFYRRVIERDQASPDRATEPGQALRLWRSLQTLASGQTWNVAMPEVPAPIARWLDADRAHRPEPAQECAI